jgi:hypothetical protein
MNTGLWNMDSRLAAPLGARLRAPVGWRTFDAPVRPGMTKKQVPASRGVSAGSDWPAVAAAGCR